MALSIIIMGAAGRMGKTLVDMVRAAEDLHLAAALEQGSCLDRLEGLRAEGVIVSSDIADVLPRCPKGSVIVDFTAAAATMHTAEAAAVNGNPMVIGTTGLSEAQLARLEELAGRIPILRSANMSVGVNVIMDILPRLTAMLGDGYDVEMMEIHHNKKKDAPSGTALLLADPCSRQKAWARERSTPTASIPWSRAATTRSASSRCAAATWWATTRSSSRSTASGSSVAVW